MNKQRKTFDIKAVFIFRHSTTENKTSHNTYVAYVVDIIENSFPIKSVPKIKLVYQKVCEIAK
jgi:hypothetical protein